MLRYVITLLLFVPCLTAGHNGTTRLTVRRRSEVNSNDLKHRLFLSRAHMQFTLDLMSTMMIQYFAPERKLLETFSFSPLSLQSSLMMMQLGARGNTRKEISDALYLSQMDAENATFSKSHEIFGESARSLLEDPNLSRLLNIANQVFVQKDLIPTSTYELALKQYHASRLRLVDFAADPQQLMNDWIAKETKGLITQFLSSPPSPATLLMAVNVLSFQGEWQYRFNPMDTETQARFRRTNGALSNVQMMVGKLPAGYAYNSDLKTTVIELPYRVQRLGMFLLLPDDVNGIFPLMRSLNESVLTQLISSMRKDSKGVNVRLPKFAISSVPRMTDILRNSLRIRSLFSAGEADLSGMFLNLPGSGHVNDFLHRVVLKVDEKGTVGAAASATVVERVGAFSGAYFEADHPFMFFLTDKQTGLILFAGVYAGPDSSSPHFSG